MYQQPNLTPPYKRTGLPTVSPGICSTRLSLFDCFDCSLAILISVSQIVCWAAITTNLSIINQIFTDNAYIYLTFFLTTSNLIGFQCKNKILVIQSDPL